MRGLAQALLRTIVPGIVVALPVENDGGLGNGGGSGVGIFGDGMPVPTRINEGEPGLILGGDLPVPAQANEGGGKCPDVLALPLPEDTTMLTGKGKGCGKGGAVGVSGVDDGVLEYLRTRTPPSKTTFTSTEPTRTSIFPYDAPQIKFYRYNGTKSTNARPNTTATTVAKPTFAAAGPLESMMKALNINVPTQHMSLLPTHSAEFPAAASSIVDMVGGQQMRAIPKEVEVSPGHMPAVWDATKRLQDLKLTGKAVDLTKIYFAWAEFLDELILPPRLDPSVRFSKDDMQKYWHDLYEAWYMARVRSAKMSLAQEPKDNNLTSGGATAKQWGLFSTSWQVSGQHLNQVDRYEDHPTERPGHGLHKRMQKCGTIKHWDFQYDRDQVLECAAGYVPYSPKPPEDMTKQQMKQAAQNQKHFKEAEKDRKKHPDKYPPKKTTLSDLETDIEATEPLPPEQDDAKWSWWTGIGNSGCRLDEEQPAAQGDYDKQWGDDISHPPVKCVNTTEANGESYVRCAKMSLGPQNNIVTRNGTDYLHINYYAWMQNAYTRVTQLRTDKKRRDSGMFTVDFDVVPGWGAEHCIKKQLRKMGWTTEIKVKNKTHLVPFIFEILGLVATAAIPFIDFEAVFLDGGVAASVESSSFVEEGLAEGSLGSSSLTSLGEGVVCEGCLPAGMESVNAQLSEGDRELIAGLAREERALRSLPKDQINSWGPERVNRFLRSWDSLPYSE